ncbi:aldehyde dehydrogenase (NAD+), partial [Tremellales sp. Uapishka_1]
MTTSTELTLPSGRTYLQPTGLYMNGSFRPSSSPATIKSIDPSTEAVIISVAAASAFDVDDAVRFARTAFEAESWNDLPPAGRGQLLNKLADLVEADAQLLAEVESWDSGKTMQTALEDIAGVVDTFRYYAGWADKNPGESHRFESSKHGYTLHEPLGVCAGIIPFNYPLGMLSWKVAPALACGNVIIIKPAEQTPLSALVIADLFDKAGFPPGVVQILNGTGAEAGAALASHMDVDKIAFTGSTVTGRRIMEAAAKSNLKNVTLELGGKSPAIVFNDADLEQAVKWCCLVGMFMNQSQVCTSTSRIYVQDQIYDRFIELFLEATKKDVILGNAEDSYHGPLVSKAQEEKVLEYIELGKKEGAKLVCGGVRQSGKGYYVEPTVFVDVGKDMRIINEEIFGPVCCIAKFSTEEEVLRLANESTYGLAASVYTENIRTAHRMVRKLQAGQVSVNSAGDVSMGLPFGGYKSSGIGRELGSYALQCYSQAKTVHWNLTQRL